MRRRGGTCVRHPASLLSSPLLSSSHSPSLSLTLHPSYLLSNRIRPLAGLFACASPKHLDATRVRRRVGYPSRHLHRRRTRVLCAPPPTHPPTHPKRFCKHRPRPLRVIGNPGTFRTNNTQPPVAANPTHPGTHFRRCRRGPRDRLGFRRVQSECAPSVSALRDFSPPSKGEEEEGARVAAV